ncbi:MAG TPA: hypothetical protein VGK74_25715 [Symbiobacteriaceae bacterium]|jgi:chromosome segregation ATPase
MGFFTWLGRGPEKERAYARLTGLKEQFGGYGDRIIKLSARTDIARKSAGSTKQAFEFVEQAFLAATQEYTHIGDLLQSIETGLEKGRIGEFGAADQALRKLGEKFAELERHLAAWEAKWQDVPRQIEDVRQALAELKAQAQSAAEALGGPLPLDPRLAAAEQHLERTVQTLAAGNPVEAGHLVDDLRLALRKLGNDVGGYISGVGAIAQVEQDLAEAKTRLGTDATGEAVAAMAAAEALLPRLRPALAAGKLEQFQQDLLQIQKQLHR